MKLKKFSIHAVMTLFSLMSCGRNTTDSTKVRLNLIAPEGEVSTASEPGSVADFDCYGVMLVNPSASLNSNSCLLTDSGAAGSTTNLTLNYQRFIGGFYKDDPIEFEILNGRDRVIQLIGLKTNFGANTSQARSSCLNIQNERPSQFSHIYFIGESEKFEILPGKTTTVPVQNQFANPNIFKLNSCTGSSKPSPTIIAGPPVLAQLKIQDNLSILASDTCIGGMLELLDASGLPAKISEDITIRLQTAGGLDRFYRNFESCSGAGLSVADLDFFDGTNRFNHIPIFFKANDSSTTAINLVKQSGPATLTTVDTALTVSIYTIPIAAGSIPQLQIFDSFANRSTVSAHSLNPIVVKRGVCRSAQVQITGTSLPPQPILLSSGGSPNVTITAIKDGTGIFNFYSNKSCSANGSSLNSISIPLTFGATMPYVAEFSYLVPSDVNSSFRLEAQINLNDAIYGNPILDLNLNNYFLIQD